MISIVLVTFITVGLLGETMECQKVRQIVEMAMKEAGVKTKEDRAKANAEISDAIKDILSKLDNLVVDEGPRSRRSPGGRSPEQENYEDKCGAGPLPSCPVRVERSEHDDNHVCRDYEPLEPLIPDCNCGFCTGDGSPPIEPPLKTSGDSPVYAAKWKTPFDPLEKTPSCLTPEDQETSGDRHRFSCQIPGSVFNDPSSRPKVNEEVAEQMKLMAENPEKPSEGIRKYHQKRDQEGEL